MLRSLLVRGHKSKGITYVYRFEEITRFQRFAVTRDQQRSECARLRVIGLFFPLPVSIQFENAPVPKEKKERIDRFDGIVVV